MSKRNTGKRKASVADSESSSEDEVHIYVDLENNGRESGWCY